MTNTLFDAVGECSSMMKLDFSANEFATLADAHNFSNDEILAVAKVFEHLKEKKSRATIEMLLRTSRLPLKNPKTFENFDFTRITGRNVDRLRSICTLSAVYAHKNLAFIGKTGTGKTHLAQAFGYECCKRGIKVYFIKMSELRDRMTAARRSGKEGTLLAALVRPSCLIIDEVGHCEFDKENTRLFFDMVDRRYHKEGNYNMVFTSNKDPSLWKENFCESDSLLCALDRIFDDAVVFTIKGDSYRGRKLETVSLRTATSAVTPSTRKTEF